MLSQTLHTYFLGLSVGVILQFAKEGVLLGQQNFDVLHTHTDYPGANVRLKSVDALVGERGTRGEEADTPYAAVRIQIRFTSKFRCEHSLMSLMWKINEANFN